MFRMLESPGMAGSEATWETTTVACISVSHSRVVFGASRTGIHSVDFFLFWAFATPRVLGPRSVGPSALAPADCYSEFS